MTDRAAGVALDDATLPRGYAMEVEQNGPVGAVRVRDATAGVVASGYCAEARGVFVFDRISTHADHRRRGFGRAVMAALGRLQKDPQVRRALVATPEGRALYLTLGWTDLLPYATARRVMEWSG